MSSFNDKNKNPALQVSLGVQIGSVTITARTRSDMKVHAVDKMWCVVSFVHALEKLDAMIYNKNRIESHPKTSSTCFYVIDTCLIGGAIQAPYDMPSKPMPCSDPKYVSIHPSVHRPNPNRSPLREASSYLYALFKTNFLS